MRGGVKEVLKGHVGRAQGKDGPPGPAGDAGPEGTASVTLVSSPLVSALSTWIRGADERCGAGVHSDRGEDVQGGVLQGVDAGGELGRAP